jgi:hypothetical protein
MALAVIADHAFVHKNGVMTYEYSIPRLAARGYL